MIDEIKSEIVQTIKNNLTSTETKELIKPFLYNILYPIKSLILFIVLLLFSILLINLFILFSIYRKNYL